MHQTLIYILFGYLSGSILYAQIFLRLFGKKDRLENSKDHNPGTANAFMLGGFWCGMCTLICDLFKGAIPVLFYINTAQVNTLSLSLVVAAPVVGHAFPLFYQFQGGKGIAVTFGCLLGLLPIWQPLVTLAFFFVFYSLVLRIRPHFQRTLISYLSALVCMIYLRAKIWFGFVIITIVVCFKLRTSKEKREKTEVKLLWMH